MLTYFTRVLPATKPPVPPAAIRSSGGCPTLFFFKGVWKTTIGLFGSTFRTKVGVACSYGEHFRNPPYATATALDRTVRGNLTASYPYFPLPTPAHSHFQRVRAYFLAA